MFISMDNDPSYEVTFISSTINEEPSSEPDVSLPVPSSSRQTTSSSASTATTSQTSAKLSQTLNSSSRSTDTNPCHNKTTSEVKVRPHISALMNDSSITLLPTEENRPNKVGSLIIALLRNSLESFDSNLKEVLDCSIIVLQTVKTDIDTLLEEIDNTRNSEPSKTRPSLNKSQVR